LAVACALVGDPDLLFLDEPTTGLDPQSRRQLWDIIERFKARGRTVMLTTHYMDEAERLCDRVAIVDKGKVIALGTPPELIRRVGGDQIVEFSLAGPAALEHELGLDDLPSVQTVRAEGGGFALTARELHRVVPALLDRLRQRDRALAGLTTRSATLEDVFVALTGRHIRDEGEAAA
jgi:ABC-2 type transport system ATP-binding protein